MIIAHPPSCVRGKCVCVYVSGRDLLLCLRMSLLPDSMPDDEELDCVPSKRKLLKWTPLSWLNSLSHHTGFLTSEDFNKRK